MKWDLEGGVAVITGAASGIGRALAESLAREGMSIALVDLDAAGLEETAHRCGAARGLVTTHVFDVGDAKCMETFAAEVIDRHGRVTLLINNAGVTLTGTAEEVLIEEIDWLMRINFFGVVHGVKYFLPLLKREPRAHIVNLSSIFGIITAAGNSAYCASKFAIRGYTEVLQKELEGSTVGVSCVHPGKVRTQLSRRERVSAGIKDPSIRGMNLDGVDKHGLTSPEAAAQRIVEGVKQGEKRILIGPDAIWYDRIQRAFPVRYDQILKALRKLGAAVIPSVKRNGDGASRVEGRISSANEKANPEKGA